MDEDRRKLMLAVEEEIARICGGEMEYVAWLGKAAAMLTATMATCKKLMELAEAQGRPFEDKVKIQIAFLGWFGQLQSMIAASIESLGGVIDSSTGELLPLTMLEPMAGMYVAAHRFAYALWRDREETRLLWKDVPTIVN